VLVPPTVPNSTLVLADLHCPYQNNEFIDRVVKLAKSWGINNVVILGDLLDLEQYSSYIYDESKIIEQGLAAAEHITDVTLADFPSILWLMGNHEERLYKRLGKDQISQDRLKRLVTTSDRVSFSRMYYAMTEDGSWMICHPGNYSRPNPGGLIAQYCAKYQCNVIAGHMHLIAKTQDISGKYVGMVIGTCAGELEYDIIQPTNNPIMCNGAVILRDSYAWQLDQWSDWETLAKLGE
jgi:predicted phosphodiesterase